MGKNKKMALFKELFEINFTWRKPVNGWVLSEHPLLSELYSDTAKYFSEEDGGEVSWHPFEDNSIFAQFAASVAEDEVFHRWANQLGRLTQGTHLDFEALAGALTPDEEYFWRNEDIKPIEPVSLWYSTHKELSDLFRLWQSLMMPCEKLSEFFEWEKTDNHTYFVYYPNGKEHAMQERNASNRKIPFFEPQEQEPRLFPPTPAMLLYEKESWSKWEQVKKYYPENIIEPAKLFVENEIQKKLEEYGVVFYPHDITMNELAGRKAWRNIEPVLKKARTDKQKIEVPDLLGALWLQFHFFIKGYTTVKACRYCGEWFCVTEGQRSDREYHNKCSKMKERAEAKKLKATDNSL